MEVNETPLRRTKSVLLKALCDMLRPVIDDLVVLDLFAGSGRVGSTLLDEGARQVYAVDLREKPGEFENIKWFSQDVETFIGFGPPEPVGLIFMDPPYDSDYPTRLLEILAEKDWLQENAIVAIETRSNEDALPRIAAGRFYLMRCRRYGGSKLWIYQAGREKAAPGEHPDE